MKTFSNDKNKWKYNYVKMDNNLFVILKHVQHFHNNSAFQAKIKDNEYFYDIFVIFEFWAKK